MEVNENHTLLAYADDIIILGDTKQDTVNSMSNLMEVCKHMGGGLILYTYNICS